MFLPDHVPWVIPLTLLFILGLFVGGQLNRGIYRLAWYQRPIGPWSAAHPDAPPRCWWDKLPVVGWTGLRRESSLHGAGYWIRPLLIELLFAVGLAALYGWEISGGLMPAASDLRMPSVATVHAQYLSHAILISFMLVASFIDLDEKTIPDEITVPGMLLGLILAALWPSSHLPVASTSVDSAVDKAAEVTSLTISTPNDWPALLDSRAGLAIGLACLAAWMYGILPKTWWTRSGLGKAFVYLAASIVRDRGLPRRLGLLVAGWAGIVGVWFVGGPRWHALLSALVGAAFAGGLIWSVRIVATRALGREAMGFGDVTLMAMIGAYVGWQPSLFIFFLAPFAALFIAVAQWVLTRRKDIAYGPYLCLATLILIVCWRQLWQRWGEVFWPGWLVPAMLAVCIVLMAILLMAWSLVLRGVEALFGSSSADGERK